MVELKGRSAFRLSRAKREAAFPAAGAYGVNVARRELLSTNIRDLTEYFCMQSCRMSAKKRKKPLGRPRIAAPNYGALSVRLTELEVDQIRRAAAAQEKSPCRWGAEACREKLI